MGRVDAEEAAAVGTGLLDGDLAGRRAHGNILFSDHHRILHLSVVNSYRTCDGIDLGTFDDAAVCVSRDWFQQLDCLTCTQALYHTASDKGQCDDQVQGKQDVYRYPRQVCPEVSESLFLNLSKASYKGKQYGYARCGRYEVLYGKTARLREVTQCGFT